jgi:hypothetical protein
MTSSKEETTIHLFLGNAQSSIKFLIFSCDGQIKDAHHKRKEKKRKEKKKNIELWVSPQIIN